MTNNATNLQTLADVIREHKEIRRQLEEVKKLAKYADESAEKAHKRIDSLERRLDAISTQLESINAAVREQGGNINRFDKKQDLFLTNTWQLVKYLLILLAGIITILGGLVGVKISLPL
jgi:chromosome segregation ATPase